MSAPAEQWPPLAFPHPGRRNNRPPIPTPPCAASCANGRKSWRSYTVNLTEPAVTTGQNRSSRISSSVVREKAAAARCASWHVLSALASL